MPRNEQADPMKRLQRDPMGLLVAADDAALRSMARRELLGETTPELNVAELPGVRQAVARQQPDGRWKYPGGNPQIRSRAAYDQMETYRQLGVLVCKFGLDRQHPAVAAAAEFLSSCQTQAGDYRGIYGHQYTPNYSAAITELLIRAGYEHSAQVDNAIRWLLALRQDDGGWAIPARTLGMSLNVMLTARQTFEPDRSRPSSHLITGICPRSTPWPGWVSGSATPTSPVAWSGSPATRNPAGCGIPGATGPRPPERSVGCTGHMPDAQHHQRVAAGHAVTGPGCGVPQVPGPWDAA
jgi:Squalene-hopene cyclase C-terminal domain